MSVPEPRHTLLYSTQLVCYHYNFQNLKNNLKHFFVLGSMTGDSYIEIFLGVETVFDPYRWRSGMFQTYTCYLS